MVSGWESQYAAPELRMEQMMVGMNVRPPTPPPPVLPRPSQGPCGICLLPSTTTLPCTLCHYSTCSLCLLRITHFANPQRYLTYQPACPFCRVKIPLPVLLLLRSQFTLPDASPSADSDQYANDTSRSTSGEHGEPLFFLTPIIPHPISLASESGGEWSEYQSSELRHLRLLRVPPVPYHDNATEPPHLPPPVSTLRRNAVSTLGRNAVSNFAVVTARYPSGSFPTTPTFSSTFSGGGGEWSEYGASELRHLRHVRVPPSLNHNGATESPHLRPPGFDINSFWAPSRSRSVPTPTDPSLSGSGGVGSEYGASELRYLRLVRVPPPSSPINYRITVNFISSSSEGEGSEYAATELRGLGLAGSPSEDPPSSSSTVVFEAGGAGMALSEEEEATGELAEVLASILHLVRRTGVRNLASLL